MSKLCVITGRRGKGKTSRAFHLARKLSRGVVVFDATEAFAIGVIVHNRAEFEAALEQEISPIVWQIAGSESREDAVEADLREFVCAIKYIRDISVIVDETSYMQSPNWIAPALDDEIRVGRRRHHDVYLTQHRMADCNGILLDLVTEFEFFQSTNPPSLKRIADYCGADVAGTVSVLGDYELLHYDVDSARFSVNNQPEFWREYLAPEEADANALAAAANQGEGT